MKSLHLNQRFILIILPLIIVVLTAIFTPLGEWVINNFKSKNARFIVVNYITRPDSLIIIQARNNQADRNEVLEVEFDGFILTETAVPIENKEPQQWAINILKSKLPQKSFEDGEHTIKVGFKGDAFSEDLKIVFSTVIPVVSVKIINNTGDSSGQIIKVEAASKLQIPEDTIKVEVTYYYNGKEQKLNIPVKRVVEQQTGAFYFEFETAIQGLHKISRNDPNYSQPFFAIRVSDQAGNNFYQRQSYAEYMAPGEKVFGVNDIAEIKVKKNQIEGKTQTTYFKVTPKITVKKLRDGTPAIVLTVVNTATNYNELTWDTKAKDVEPLTIIYKNNKNIGTSFTNQFIDILSSGDEISIYRVEKKSINSEIVYSSVDTKFKASTNDSSVKTNTGKSDTLTVSRKFRNSFDTSISDKKGIIEVNSLVDYIMVTKGQIIPRQNVSYNFKNDCYQFTPFVGDIEMEYFLVVDLLIMNLTKEDHIKTEVVYTPTTKENNFSEADYKPDVVLLYNDKIKYDGVKSFTCSLRFKNRVSGFYKILLKVQDKVFYTTTFNVCN